MADTWPIKNVWAIIKQDHGQIKNWDQSSLTPYLKEPDVAKYFYQLLKTDFLSYHLGLIQGHSNHIENTNP